MSNPVRVCPCSENSVIKGRGSEEPPRDQSCRDLDEIHASHRCLGQEQKLCRSNEQKPE